AGDIDMYLAASGSTWRIIAPNSASTGYGVGTGGLGFYRNELAGDYSLKLLSNGNVVIPYNLGIGTTSPTHRLDVTGDIAIHMAPTQGGLYFGDNSPVNQKWQIGYWEPSILPPDGGLVVTETGVADYRMTFLAGGNVGIGTATPTSPAPGPGGTPATGNVDANDVFLRSTGKWVSQGGEPTLSGPFTATKTTWPNLGPHTICMLTQTYFELTPPGGSNNVICNVQRSPAPSFDWQLIASASTSGAQCVAYCLDW
ncbi:MAG: hypothetical protein HYZ89_03070, partial [Candidatus Omnitrophica bacterium]|nr:hypothetical protein [Candidatus Omnitrophota bacterium]